MAADERDFGVQVFAPAQSPPPAAEKRASQGRSSPSTGRLVFLSPPRRTAPVIPVCLSTAEDDSQLDGGGLNKATQALMGSRADAAGMAQQHGQIRPGSADSSALIAAHRDGGTAAPAAASAPVLHAALSASDVEGSARRGSPIDDAAWPAAHSGASGQQGEAAATAPSTGPEAMHAPPLLPELTLSPARHPPADAPPARRDTYATHSVEGEHARVSQQSSQRGEALRQLLYSSSSARTEAGHSACESRAALHESRDGTSSQPSMQPSGAEAQISDALSSRGRSEGGRDSPSEAPHDEPQRSFAGGWQHAHQRRPPGRGHPELCSPGRASQHMHAKAAQGDTHGTTADHLECSTAPSTRDAADTADAHGSLHNRAATRHDRGSRDTSSRTDSSPGGQRDAEGREPVAISALWGACLMTSPHE